MKSLFRLCVIPTAALVHAAASGGEKHEQMVQLLAWHEHAGGKISRCVNLSWTEKWGFHFVTSVPLKAGTRIVSTQESALLTPAALNVELPTDAFSEEEKLALALWQQKALGSASFWHPYIQALPASMMSTLFFTKQELGLLKGSLAHAYGVQKRAEFERFYKRAARALKLIPGAPPPLAKDALKWAWATVLARGLPHPFKEEMPFLAPLYDMFNHADVMHWPRPVVDVDCGIDVEESQEFLSRYSLLDHEAGAQVFHNYRLDLPSHVSLTHFGFVTAATDKDFILMPTYHISNDDPAYKSKVQLLQMAGMQSSASQLRPWQQRKSTEASGLPPSLLRLMRLTRMLPEHAEIWLERASKGKEASDGLLSFYVSKAMDAEIVYSLISTLQAMQANYRTKPKEARAALTDLQTKNDAVADQKLHYSMMCMAKEHAIIQQALAGLMHGEVMEDGSIDHMDFFKDLAKTHLEL